jgi:hypothetical protein
MNQRSKSLDDSITKKARSRALLTCVAAVKQSLAAKTKE